MPHAQLPLLVDLRIRGHLEVLLEEANPWNRVSDTQYRYEWRPHWAPLYRLALPLYCQCDQRRLDLGYLPEPFPIRPQGLGSGHQSEYRFSSR